MTSKSQQLKGLLQGSTLEYLMEAHNGLSAKIAERAGFRGIWGSGLSISTALGVRDNNEASWTQVLEAVEFMSDATTIPILLDADTGYGDFNNVRCLVRKLEQRQIAGMCIEDKLFPKKNSLLKGAAQPLAEIGEFVGKIKAAKDTQQDSDFCVVARTEAFIAGRGLDEALERATAYADAGADAVLVHSKIRTADEIFSFMKAWQQDCPVVIVPTTYFDTPSALFERAGVSLIIWANHLMRSCVSAMETTAAKIFTEKSLSTVENEMARVDHVFAMFDYDELQRAELKYLPKAGEPNADRTAAS
jgi:phosphoenolpyruvate phosphomutase